MDIIWQTEKGWRLETYELTRPDGTVEQKGLVRHPGAVALVPLTAEHHVLMLRQYRKAFDQVILEIPAGTRGWDEDWTLCAQRELQEESGHRAAELVDLGEVWPAPGVSDERLRIYLATGLTPDPLPQDFDEEIEVVAMPLSELEAMALDGRLQDGKSVVGILRVVHFLQHGRSR